MLVETLLMLAGLGVHGGQEAAPGDPRGAAAFSQVYPNWTLACDDPGFRGHRIQFDVTLDPSGRIVDGPTPVRPRDDTGWLRAAETAREALLRSAPFDVPPDFAGGTYRPTFNTSRACPPAAEADED